jgi:hypothetical protein
LADGCDIEEGRSAFEWEKGDRDEPNLYLEECEWGFYTSRKWRGRKQKTPDANTDFGGIAR